MSKHGQTFFPGILRVQAVSKLFGSFHKTNLGKASLFNLLIPKTWLFHLSRFSELNSHGTLTGVAADLTRESNSSFFFDFRNSSKRGSTLSQVTRGSPSAIASSI